MSSSVPSDCVTVLATSLALIEQFHRSLKTPNSTSGTSSATDDYPSPLLLLKAASESLKSTVTKLSLLSITPPFTGSAIVSMLKPMNDSILPSLVTAVLLVTPTLFPDSFAAESNRLAIAALLELRSLLEFVDARAKDGKPKSELNKKDKQAITEATGRTWETCDSLIKFSTDGVSGFVVKEIEKWLALMKDAVQELQEWDPEEDVDGDLFGDADSDEEGSSAFTEKSKDHDQATIAAGVKDQALKVLSRIPQSIHVVVRQRIAKMPPELTNGDKSLDVKHKTILDKIIKQARNTSECIDETAEAMYMGDPELSLKKAGEARALTIDIVESVIPPWVPVTSETEPKKEDTFIKRALLWIEQVDTTSTTVAKPK